MEKTILFPKAGGFIHGGGYNPEQWLDRPDILSEDIRMMKKAGINCATPGRLLLVLLRTERGRIPLRLAAAYHG